MGLFFDKTTDNRHTGMCARAWRQATESTWWRQQIRITKVNEKAAWCKCGFSQIHVRDAGLSWQKTPDALLLLLLLLKTIKANNSTKFDTWDLTVHCQNPMSFPSHYIALGAVGQPDKTPWLWICIPAQQHCASHLFTHSGGNLTVAS